MNSHEELLSLIRRGGEERRRLEQAWRRMEVESAELSYDAADAGRKAVSALKWGGGAFLASAVLFRFLKFRRGFRGIRWLWSLAPLVARFALRR